MKVTRKDIDELNIQLELILEISDYNSLFEKKLREYKSKVQMKGFRQGKTPSSLIKKMYGSGILTEVVNEKLGQLIEDYLKENEIAYLGQPMPVEDHFVTDFDPNNLKDITFKFDIGLNPEFDIKGYNKQSKYNDYKIIVEDELVEKELTHMQKQLGERVDIENDILEDDVVKFAVVEQEGDKYKEGGVAAEVPVLINRVVSDDLKKKLLQLKLGDEIGFDINDLVESKDESYLKKYVLGIEEEVVVGVMFSAKIIEVKRVEPAQLNEDTFKKYFGEESEIKTLDDAKEKIKENIENYFSGSTLSLSNREMLEKVLTKNNFDLPTDLLKRWLKQMNEKATVQQIDDDMPAFEKDLRWRLIKTKIASSNEIQISPEEIRNAMYVQVEAYFRNNYMFDVDQINKTVDQLMQDQEQMSQVHEEILSSKVFNVFREKIGLKEVFITPDDLNKKVETYNKK